MVTYDQVVGLLGTEAFLVPCEWATKKPLVTYVERPFEGTKSPAYRALFDSEPRNIAVYLGRASGGLCAIDFDGDEDLAAFLAANPRLSATTRTRGSRGGMIWLRIDGQYPASCNTSHFEWRADKRLSTVAGRHPKGMDYSLVVEAAPVEVRFEEIIWPGGWELPWRLAPLQQLEREFGPALAVSEKGAVKLNQRFIVGKLMREHDVLFDDLTGRFYRYLAETGVWSHVSEVKVRAWFDEEFRRLIAELKGNNNGDPRLWSCRSASSPPPPPQGSATNPAARPQSATAGPGAAARATGSWRKWALMTASGCQA